MTEALRIRYRELRRMQASSLRDAFRDRLAGFKRAWTAEQLRSWAGEETRDNPPLPVERLMLRVAELGFCAGFDAQLEGFLRREVSRMLSACPLAELLAGVPPAEADEFIADLRLLGLVVPDEGA